MVYISIKCKCCIPVGCDHMRAEKHDSSMDEVGSRASPISATAAGTTIYGHGAAGGGSDRCRCEGCVTLLRRDGDPLLAGMQQHRAGQGHQSFDAPTPPFLDSRAGRVVLPPRLLCQGRGNTIPSVEGLA